MKVWQNISREDIQHLVMSMSSRVQTVFRLQMIFIPVLKIKIMLVCPNTIESPKTEDLGKISN